MVRVHAEGQRETDGFEVAADIESVDPDRELATYPPTTTSTTTTYLPACLPTDLPTNDNNY